MKHGEKKHPDNSGRRKSYNLKKKIKKVVSKFLGNFKTMM